jgi:hypothetical protein
MIARSLVLLTALLAMIAVTGCGGGSSGASASTDVSQLLKDTFSGAHPVKSGKLSLMLRADAQGGSSSTQGPISVNLSGPFQSQGKGKLPKLDLEAKIEGAGQNISAGLVSTGTKGFLKFQGQSYVASDAIFQQFKRGYEQSQAQASKQKGQSLATLGIDPQRWLTNPRNEGDAKVGGTDTIRITGDVNVPKLLDDVNTALQRTRALGVQGAQSLPQQLTPAQRKQAANAIKKLSVEVYTGKDDRTLRRMVLALTAKSQAQTVDLNLDLQLTEVNQDQTIAEPAAAKPLDQLLGQLGGLSGLSGSGSGSGSGSSSGSGSGSSSGSANSKNLQKYSQCIAKAGNNATKARKCADLLAP